LNEENDSPFKHSQLSKVNEYECEHNESKDEEEEEMNEEHMSFLGEAFTDHTYRGSRRDSVSCASYDDMSEDQDKCDEDYP
jgi:hypothetical protein